MLKLSYRFHFYRPQRRWGKLIFSEACVKNSVLQRGGLVLGGMVQGVPGPGVVYSWVGGLVPGGAWSRGGGLVLEGGACSRGVWSQGGGIPACTEADSPPGEAATAADRTHPTGMHSCF